MTLPNNKAAKLDYVPRVREFNRFYTQQIGVLRERLLESPYSLTEVRLMFELSHRANTTASELADLLVINHGYLSRILKRFTSRGLVERARSSTDRRELLLNLTRKGQQVYAPLNARANAEIRHLLRHLSVEEIGTLLRAMDTIQQLLSRPVRRADR